MTAAKRFESQLVSSFALASRVTGEIGNARAVIRLADGDPDGALATLRLLAAVHS